MFAKESILKKSKHLIPIIPVYFIVISVTISFIKYFIMNYDTNTDKYDPEKMGVFKLFVILLFFICFVMTIITHLKAMFTHPGTVSLEYQKSNVSHPTYFCKKCNIPRPERAKHCKICKICILKYDHHCPWIANCVGINNQKTFFQFLFYATLGDLIAFLCLISKLFNMSIKIKTKEKGLFSVLFAMSDKLLLLTGTLLSIAMVISIGFLLVVQFKLICNNITTVEVLSSNDYKSSPYYDNNKFNSWIIVMGYNWTEWFIPTVKLTKFNNGYSFGKLSSNMDHIHNELEDKTINSV